ncbi:hypothetical protein NW762_005334 [Fusarium torreyae]|uniref:Uncharacterized protein n=1 Tax=Fusarium torreyae TaxID=1237075 RepID=A0A9W8S6K9_9HYPO|nr:hypothetical protein NW762_005334 [Fusarium torreyae]
MDGSQSETTVHKQLESSNKRHISRVSSSSPSQAQASKRVCHQDNPLVDALMIHQPTPQSAASQAVAVLEEVAASQESTQSLELVDNWLEETYPSELHEKHSRSDGFFHPVEDSLLLLKRPQSAPAIMSGNTNRRASAQGFGQTPTPLPSTRGSQTGQATSPAPTTTTNRTGPVVESPRYRDTNLAENDILLRDSRNELPPHISTLVSSVQRD